MPVRVVKIGQLIVIAASLFVLLNFTSKNEPVLLT
jgi:hypothetical protein